MKALHPLTKRRLAEPKARPEATLAALKREQAGFVVYLKEQSLTEEQIQVPVDSANALKENLEAMNAPLALDDDLW